MTLDMVGISEMQKCGLKYVIHTPGRHFRPQVITLSLRIWNYAGMVNAVLPFNYAHFPVRGRMLRWNKQSYCMP
jgi:hypothetical protein